MLKLIPLFLFALGVGALLLTVGQRAVAQDGEQERPNRVVLPGLASDKVRLPDPPTPTPEPLPYQGPISRISLASASIPADAIVEERHTQPHGDGRDRFQDPTHPSRIAWYPAFGRPGYRAGNTILAAHVDYVNYGWGPFWRLTSAQVGDLLHVTMDNGLVYTYSVQSVQIIHLDHLDMQAIVYPQLASNRERVTLISCGGTFVPRPGGGGEYLSRVVLVAERVIE